MLVKISHYQSLIRLVQTEMHQEAFLLIITNGLKTMLLFLIQNATTYVITNAQGPDSGIYYCEITNPDLPGYVVKRSNITLDVGGFLSVDEATFNNSVSIFPNPTSDYIYIELPKNNTNTHISIHNILGKKVTELDTTTNQIKLKRIAL